MKTTAPANGPAGASGYAQGPGSGFITSSVRKSKGKSPSPRTRYDDSMFRIALQFHARHSVQIAKRIVPNALNVDRDPTPFPH